MFHARGIALLAFGLLVLTVTAPAGVEQEFNLTYTRYPLDAAGTVDRDQAPMRFWYKGNRSRTDILMMEGGQSQLLQEIVEYCRPRIADFKIPSVIEFREALPKSPTGKVRRALLLEDVEEG